jgi:hypothetical protein
MSTTPDGEPKHSLRRLRKLMNALQHPDPSFVWSSSVARFGDENRFNFLRLVAKYPGIASSLYHFYPEEYKVALEECKRLFEPAVWNPDHYIGWTTEGAMEADRGEDEMIDDKEYFILPNGQRVVVDPGLKSGEWTMMRTPNEYFIVSGIRDVSTTMDFVRLEKRLQNKRRLPWVIARYRADWLKRRNP